jgi:hypothetical protein
LYDMTRWTVRSAGYVAYAAALAVGWVVMTYMLTQGLLHPGALVFGMQAVRGYNLLPFVVAGTIHAAVWAGRRLRKDAGKAPN